MRQELKVGEWTGDRNLYVEIFEPGIAGGVA